MANRLIVPQLKNALIYSRVTPVITNAVSKYSYISSHVHKEVEDIDNYTKFEVTKSPEEWQYVERILAPLIVPEVKPKTEYPSDWTPQNDTCKNYEYFVKRTKNHMLPVYLSITFRGMRRITEITKVQGDAFALEKELKEHVQKFAGKPIASQVNEMVGCIRIKGDYVNVIKDYLLAKGF